MQKHQQFQFQEDNNSDNYNDDSNESDIGVAITTN